MSRVLPESARIMRIESLTEDMQNARVRLAGRCVVIYLVSHYYLIPTISPFFFAPRVEGIRVILYEDQTQYLLLASRTKAVWVNMSLCIDPSESKSSRFVRESFSIITVFAYVNVSKACLFFSKKKPYSRGISNGTFCFLSRNGFRTFHYLGQPCNKVEYTHTYTATHLLLERLISWIWMIGRGLSLCVKPRLRTVRSNKSKSQLCDVSSFVQSPQLHLVKCQLHTDILHHRASLFRLRISLVVGWCKAFYSEAGRRIWGCRFSSNSTKGD